MQENHNFAVGLIVYKILGTLKLFKQSLKRYNLIEFQLYDTSIRTSLHYNNIIILFMYID